MTRFHFTPSKGGIKSKSKGFMKEEGMGVGERGGHCPLGYPWNWHPDAVRSKLTLLLLWGVAERVRPSRCHSKGAKHFEWLTTSICIQSAKISCLKKGVKKFKHLGLSLNELISFTLRNLQLSSSTVTPWARRREKLTDSCQAQKTGIEQILLRGPTPGLPKVNIISLSLQSSKCISDVVKEDF